ncbi:EcsC family protein [Desulfovibrionales bacterium]
MLGVPEHEDSISGMLTSKDLVILALAVERIEKRTLIQRLLTCAGMPVDWVLRAMPESGRALIARASRVALKTALNAALCTIDPRQGQPRIWFHRLAAATLGAAGGAMGLAGFVIELPITTTAILRSIAAIARNEGEDLVNPATGLACIEVFGLGGGLERNSLESSYLATRALIARQMAAAADYLASGATDYHMAPQLIRLVEVVAPRFGVVVEEQFLGKVVPIISVMGGATINTAFMAHFQNIATGHFTVRRLERYYNPDIVAAAYRRAYATMMQGKLEPHHLGRTDGPYR